MDYVYVCRNGKNEELRYSIRSLEKHLPDVNVWVVGGKPDWYTGKFIPVDISSSDKFVNVKNQYRAITNAPEISENFVLMNDDFFVMEPVEEIRVFHGGLMKDKYESHRRQAGPGKYTEQLADTYNNLINLGYVDPLNYELHVPMPMTKDGLASVIDYPGMVRSAYGNKYAIGGDYMDDVKVVSRGWSITSANGLFLSTLDTTFQQVSNNLLRDMFPDPSSCEHP